LYLSVSTRPDYYAVSNLASFSSNPTKQHWTVLKHVIRYLKGTLNHGINSKECVAYSDADWAGDIDDRKSTSGYLFQISGGAVTWKSKKLLYQQQRQSIYSSCFIKSRGRVYIALASAAQEAV